MPPNHRIWSPVNEHPELRIREPARLPAAASGGCKAGAATRPSSGTMRSVRVSCCAYPPLCVTMDRDRHAGLSTAALAGTPEGFLRDVTHGSLRRQHCRYLHRPRRLKPSHRRPRARRPALHHHRSGKLPRLPEGIMGPQLVENMKPRPVKFGAAYIAGKVAETGLPSPLPPQNRRGMARMPHPHRRLRSVGPLDRPAQRTKLIGHGVSPAPPATASSTATKIMVVGGGDSPWRGQLLTRFGREVTVATARRIPRFQDHADRCKANPKIKWLTSTVPVDIHDLRRKVAVTAVKLRNVKTNQRDSRTSTASSSPSATSPTPSPAGQLTQTPTATSSATAAPAPTSFRRLPCRRR